MRPVVRLLFALLNFALVVLLLVMLANRPGRLAADAVVSDSSRWEDY